MIWLFLASSTVFAQRVTVTGTVTDAGGNPLPGATIQVKGSTIGSLTGAYGKYSIPVAGPDATLVFHLSVMTRRKFGSLTRQ